jgi:hypothetical protein
MFFVWSRGGGGGGGGSKNVVLVVDLAFDVPGGSGGGGGGGGRLAIEVGFFMSLQDALRDSSGVVRQLLYSFSCF